MIACIFLQHQPAVYTLSAPSPAKLLGDVFVYRILMIALSSSGKRCGYALDGRRSMLQVITTYFSDPARQRVPDISENEVTEKSVRRMFSKSCHALRPISIITGRVPRPVRNYVHACRWSDDKVL
jgi:hypothetical protein